MDKKIVDKRWIKPRHWKYMALGVFLLVMALVFAFRDTSSSVRVDPARLIIEKAIYAPFQDYIRIIGIVEPISIVYMDAVEGGIVEERLIEEGTFVKKGEIILRLSNTNLNLNILNSEGQLAEKANFLRETHINMQQQKLSLRRELINMEFDLIQKKRAHEQKKVLYEEELISREEFLKADEDFKLSQHLKELMLERDQQDSIFRKNQIEKISLNLENMERNLELIHKRQEDLNIKAPVDGQLGLLNAELGQSIGAGQRIGQVNVLTSFKIKARIDEHYIDRVRNGLKAGFERQSDYFHLTLSKVYPEVREGRFEVDLLFDDNLPENIRTGQSYHISLELGETQDAILIPRGGFFQSTGGQWVYVVQENGHEAVRRSIRIGRQNPQYYEILEGLKPGEQVVTSGYDAFGENERLVMK
jgi:HlyD family secretion protein